MSDDGDLDLEAYLGVARRRWRTLVLVPLTTVALGAIFSMTRERVFEAQTEVIVLTENTRSLFPASAELEQRFGRNPLSELQFLSSEEFRETVHSIDEEYGAEVDYELDYGLVPAETIQDATAPSIITLTARGGDAEDVAAAATRHAEAYIAERQQGAIESNAQSRARAEARIRNLSDLLRTAQDDPGELGEETGDATTDQQGTPLTPTERVFLDGALDEAWRELLTTNLLEAELADGEALARVHRAADVPSSPVAPDVKGNIILMFLAGLVLGGGVAIVRELFDGRVRDGASLARKLNTPLLGEIRRTPRSLLAPKRRPEPGVPGEALDDYRVVLNSIWLHNREGTLRSIAVTSDKPNAGRTSTAVILAQMEALRGLDVLFVDADNAEPSVAERLGLQRPAVALSDAINGDAEVGDAVVSTGTPRLRFAEASRDLEQHLDSGSFQQLLEDLQSQFDLVIMDVPAMLGRGDPRPICTAVDATIVAYDPEVSRSADVERSVESLRQAGAGFVGLLANVSSRRLRSFNQDVRPRGTPEPWSSIPGPNGPLPGRASETAAPSMSIPQERRLGSR